MLNARAKKLRDLEVIVAREEINRRVSINETKSGISVVESIEKIRLEKVEATDKGGGRVSWQGRYCKEGEYSDEGRKRRG